MKIQINRDDYAICRLDSNQDIPSWFKLDNFSTVTKTDEELSITCKSEIVPDGINCEKGWNVLKILGLLDFSLIGILSKISTILANNDIGIFVISTFDTDYILIKEENTDKAKQVLNEESYEIIES